MGLRSLITAAIVLVSLSGEALGSQVLKTTGFSTCFDNPEINVQKVNIQYSNANKSASFDVAGTNTRAVKVMAFLNVSAYGVSVFTKSFNPCDSATFIGQLCPIPVGTFAASGSQQIPEQFASQIPAIAFSVPDIAAQATLELKAIDTGAEVACISAGVGNGETVDIAAVSYVSSSIAGAAFILTGATTLVSVLSASSAGAGSAASGGMSTTTPGLATVMGYFQGIAMNGMMSVSYPPVYRAFSKNFAFSTGMIPWTSMQTSIDSFRAATGGNLTEANVQYLSNATLVFNGGSTSMNTGLKLKRAFDVASRQISTSISADTNTTATVDTSTAASLEKSVHGIAAYIEQLSIPAENSFMTALLIISIIIAAIIVCILATKAILEVWALFGSFPKGLTGFRKHYWGTMARSIVQLILILYGTLVLYSFFQLLSGDSWLGKVLAGIVLGTFTAILIFFTVKISQMAKRSKQQEGDAGMLYDEKDVWLKYSIFYDSYKRDFWWTFVPAILYMFSKGVILAVGDGHGLPQTIAQITVEVLMLLFLIFVRPYERKSGNVISIMIQVVRALSVVCILVFVEELGIAQTVQTAAGFALVIIQSVLAGLLAILILVNAVIICWTQNPHRKRRKAAEAAEAGLDVNRSTENLTPLYADNELLKKSNTNNSSQYSSSLEKSSFAATTQAQGMTYTAPTYQSANPYSNRGFAATPGGQWGPQAAARPQIADQEESEYSRYSRVDSDGAMGYGGAADTRRLVAGSAPQSREPMVPKLQIDGFAGYRGVP